MRGEELFNERKYESDLTVMSGHWSLFILFKASGISPNTKAPRSGVVFHSYGIYQIYYTYRRMPQGVVIRIQTGGRNRVVF